MVTRGAGGATTNRPYRGDEDFRSVRRLLVETVSLTPLDFNWDVRRWDGWRYYRSVVEGDPAWADRAPSMAPELPTGYWMRTTRPWDEADRRHLADLLNTGVLAAYVGVAYDDINRRGILEPICTHPDHRGTGLAKGLMLEGLHRLHRRGARSATVATGDADPANRLYETVGFDEARRGHVWMKSLPAG